MRYVIALIASLFLAVTFVGAAEEGNTRAVVVTMNVSGYCACQKCCGPQAQGITASGKKVTANGGKFVAAPKTYAFGTVMIIPGYNDDQPVPVLDRGGAIKGNCLDLYFPTHKEALKWGRQQVEVTVFLKD